MYSGPIPNTPIANSSGKYLPNKLLTGSLWMPALISASTVEAELSDGRLECLDVPGLPIIRQWFLVYRSSVSVNPATETLRNFLLKNKEHLLLAGRGSGAENSPAKNVL